MSADRIRTNDKAKMSGNPILLTGFEPFMVAGRLAHNPTAPLVKSFTPLVAHCAVLPVEYRRASETLNRLLREHNASIWIGLGLGASRSEIDLESIAINVVSSHTADNAGEIRSGEQIISGAPLAYQTTLPIRQWQQDLSEQGLPVRVSHHAGTFLCNQVYFHALHACSAHDSTLRHALFIHIPPEDVIAPDTTQHVLAEILRRVVA